MSHYKIVYQNMVDTEKHEKAIADCKEYLGESRFNRICDQIKKHPEMTLDELHVILSLAGIEGYPVTAIYNHCFPLKG